MLEKIKELLNEIGPVEGKYLVSCFYQRGSWKVDFYSKEKHKIYTYEKINGEMKVKEDEVFQKEKKVLEPLDLSRVKHGFEKALEKHDGKEKAIVILQNLNGKVFWNITILTPEFKVINVKVDVETGEIAQNTVDNLLNFKK
jgi:uncharacterized membrane protein YkoI